MATLGIALLGTVLMSCGKPDRAIPASRPALTTEFAEVYARHCTGCHGEDGRLGPAPPHNDPVFLAIVPPEVVRDVVRLGRAGTLMPAMAGEHGQELRPDQVESVVAGMFARWARPPSELPATLPSYVVQPAGGNGERGRRLFANICANCHGDQGYGGTAGALRSAAFLELASRQLVRRIVITGRPDLGMPDYRVLGELAGKGPLTSEQIVDIVSYVESWRPLGVETATQPAGAQEESP